MNEHRVLLLYAAFLVISLGLTGKCALAATASFTISASNSAMSTSGSGSVAWTVTSVNGYSGTVQISCNPTSVPSGAKLPFCGGNVAPLIYAVPANGYATGNLTLFGSPVPCSNPCPVKHDRTRKGVASGLALAGALLVGLGFRRRAACWFALILLAAGTLAGMAGISACGGSSGSTLTPGVWPYTIVAADTSTNKVASATIDVTVPAGIHGSGLD